MIYFVVLLPQVRFHYGIHQASRLLRSPSRLFPYESENCDDLYGTYNRRSSKGKPDFAGRSIAIVSCIDSILSLLIFFSNRRKLVPMLFWPTKSRSGVFPGGLVTCGSLKRAASRISRSRRRDSYPEFVAKHPKCSPSHRAPPSAAPRVVPTSSAHKLTGDPARHLWRGLGCGSGGDLWQEISPQSPHSAPAKSEWRAPEDFVKSRSHLPDGLYAPV